MKGLRAALARELKLDLESEANVDKDGMLDGRIFIENPHFGAQFTILRIRHGIREPRSSCYRVEIAIERLPRVSPFSTFLPLTKSRRTVKKVASIARVLVAEYTGASVTIPIDKTVAINVYFLVCVEASLGAVLGGLWGFLSTGTTRGGAVGGLVGGVLGIGLTIFLAFRMFE